ncbi:MAG: hypothetical protein IBX48_09950 [Thiomicrospira sp.]|uniref:hypothetical protein n=1 Tax=Thiomicrospira sp. TaxID=935 RepID=UPI0019F7AE85|nr:hypothetical protein [Thiomicrospira sp.]MBE0494644.1 hypothetical protein [Thiomicrospira sp.]
MHTHTIELPDHISRYVNKRLDGHLEQLGDYVASLIEAEREKQSALEELQGILSEPKANIPSGLSLEDIYAKAKARVLNNAL